MSANLPLLLIVDDNPENLTVIGELLQPRFRVRVANGGPRALRLAAASPQPDLILLDVMMPDMDGYEVLSRLRAAPRTRDIPVVFLTALDSAADEERGLQLGAADYIAKPIRPAILLARVNVQLELKRARDLLSERNERLEAELSRHLQRDASDGGPPSLALGLAPPSGEAQDHLHRCQGLARVLVQHLSHHPDPTVALDESMAGHIVRVAAVLQVGQAGTAEGAACSQESAEAMGRVELETARQLEFLKVAGQVLRHHHERWDGTGHPQQLKGADIPLAARLMALVTTFEALVWPTGVAASLSPEAARAQVKRGSGTHFDPALVDAFEACFNQLALVASSAPDRVGAGTA